MKFEDLKKAMVEAMKAKDKNKKDAISSLVDAAKKIAIDKGLDREKVPEDIVSQVILKEIKTIEEQISTCPTDRTDLLDTFKQRLEYIKEYAPKMMSKDEILKLISEKFNDIVATKKKGDIMKALMPELKGKADGKLINEIIEELIK